ncbi:hypothetical protein QBC43DRAFT_326452 [Cladorrhinum sp. PSN259]|nr:hypothetical protein QBC43DRAFT_326452 [Cladorrhinum sp. PSN259]
MFTFKPLLLGLLSTTLSPTTAAHPFKAYSVKVTQLYSFPPSNPIFLENAHRLPDNRLLVSSFSPNGSLYVFDPSKPPGTEPTIVTTFPNTTLQLGIVPLGNNKYAIATGLEGELVFIRGTGNIRIISLAPHSNVAKQLDVIPVPDTYILNGVIGLSGKQSHILLSADSSEGRILRTNILTGKTDVAFADPLLDSNNHPILPLGVNGIKIRQGYLYFTNSGRGFFGRFRIDKEGNAIGKIEVLHQLEGETGFSNAYDDFVLDERTGDAYVTWHDRSLVRIKSGSWKSETIVGKDRSANGNGNDDGEAVHLKAPTALEWGREGKGELFVTTAGLVNGTRVGGQLVRVDL